MPFARSVVAILLCCAVALPGFAQTPEISRGPSHGLTGWFSGNYVAHQVPKVSFEDSPRIDKLMHAGNILPVAARRHRAGAGEQPGYRIRPLQS